MGESRSTGSVVADVLIDALSRAQDSTAAVGRKRPGTQAKRETDHLGEVEFDLVNAEKALNDAISEVRAARASMETGHRLTALLVEAHSKVKLGARFALDADARLWRRKRGGR